MDRAELEAVLDRMKEQESHMRLTKEDVWGKWEDGDGCISKGMIVAQGYPDDLTQEEIEYFKRRNSLRPMVCPVWKDKLPYKSVTVICDAKDEEEVEYWLAYVHGGGCVSRRKALKGGKVALRSDYQCW